MRLSKISRQNLEIARLVQVIKLTVGYGIKIWVADNAAFLHAGSGDVLIYDTYDKAVRAVRRIRPDVRILLEDL